MPLETTKFDMQDHLKTLEERVAYLEAVFEDAHPVMIAAALGDIARSMGMSHVAKQAGITREALYKALSDKGDPKLSTLVWVMKALGLRFAVTTVSEAA